MLKVLTAFILAALVTLPSMPLAAGQQSLDTPAIARALGRSGTAMPGGVYRVSFPRSDLKVSIGGTPVLPGLALGSYAAFKQEPQGALAVGDLVLLEEEIQPVMQSLKASGLQVTALHNHLRNEHPHVMYMHFMGTGDAAAIARALHTALALSRTPMGAAKPADTATPWFASTIEQTLGRSGKSSNGVLAISVPRQEDITMQGMAVPPAMGVATALNFEGVGNTRVATTGDFVLIGSEVGAVQRALVAHSIEVTALHSHMIGDSPTLYYMHFWAMGAPKDVAAGLKDALSHVAVKAP
ncbi:MAG TPA: DUF1259 domain-containing protein [Candidatus Baltobacteraceae bacterium]|nr:DUF1259 domain-containing protein [Candidatus Baltobacteraceae bacterium]